jgi:hypothetical protein
MFGLEEGSVNDVEDLSGIGDWDGVCGSLGTREGALMMGVEDVAEDCNESTGAGVLFTEP